MSTKRIITLSILVIGLALALYFFQKPWNTSSIKGNEVSVKDTARINKLFLANKNGIKILLEKQSDGSWRCNNKFKVDPPKINLLLATLHDMQLQHPIDPAARNTVITDLAIRGRKLEIYMDNELERTIYIGSETPEKTGTYFMNESTKEPLAIHIPGFVGYLTPRFIMDEIAWKDKLVFNEDPKNLGQLTVTYPDEPNASFVIHDNQLFDANGAQLPFDPIKLKTYLHSFQNLYLEGYLSFATTAQADSISKTTPMVSIEWQNTNKQTIRLDLFRKKVGKRTKMQLTEQDEALEFDSETYFALVNKQPELASVQQYSFGKILKKAEQFR
ncbi:hypothetical protein MASR2M44_23610 [Bacteroidota bacterium]